MTRFFLALIALVVLLAAIVVIAPGLAPVDAYKTRIETAASKALGREVTIGDDLRFKLVPQTAFHVADLEIANAEGFEAPYLARVKEADIGVRLIPLFSKSVEIDRFVLTEPDINLERAADGSINWNIAVDKSEEAPEKAGAGDGVRELRLGDVRIVDGKAAYVDAAAGKTYRAEDIDLVVRLTSLDEPLEAEGTMIFEGAPSRADLVLTSLKNLLEKAPANLKLDLSLGKTKAGGDLVIETKDALSYRGPIKFDAPDLPQFARLVGASLADSPGFDNLAIDGAATGGANSIRLADAKIIFDKIDATGNLSLDWSGARPKAAGSLAAGTIDLRPYLPPPSENDSGFPAWSEQRLDFTGLRNIDADLNLTTEKIFLNDLEFGASRLKLTIVDGRMTADIPDLGLYGGGGSGQLVVNARGPSPSIAGKFDVGSVDAQPFSVDLLKTDKLLGLGGFKLDFSASGSSQAAIMRSLDGSGRFDVADGAIKGVNLAKLARSIAEIQKSGLTPAALSDALALAQRPDEKTDFTDFLSQFDIADGLVNAPTISLTGPFLTMTGAGKVDLPGQSLDIKLAPRISTTMDNEGGSAFSAPLRIVGTFSEPKIIIDAEALLKGRAGEELRDLIGGAIGGKETDEEQAADDNETKPSKAEEAAKSILKGVFGPPPDSEEPNEDDNAETSLEETGGSARSSAPDEALAKEAVDLIFGPGAGGDKDEAQPEEEPQ